MAVAGSGPQLPTDGTGKVTGAFSFGTTPVIYLPASVLTDVSGNSYDSATSAPAGTERALIVRNIPSGSQTVANAGTFAVQDSEKIADNAGFTDGTSKVLMAGYIFDETAGTALTENDAAARIDSKRATINVLEDATTRGQRVAVSAAGRLSVDASGVAVPVTDNAGSLSVDSPGLPTALGQSTMSSSLRVVVASDQSNLPTNIAAVGGSALSSKAGGTFGQTAIPVWPNAVQRDTYWVTMNGIALAVTAGGGDKILFSMEHAGTATKTMRIRRIYVSGVVTTASAAVVGNLRLNVFRGTAASSAGTAVTPALANAASAAAETSVKHTPTIVAATGPLMSLQIFATGAGGATVGTQIAAALPILLYDWDGNDESVPMTLRAANLESLVISANGSWATTAPTITWGITVEFTEE